MTEPEAYWRGRYVPTSQAVVPVDDVGFLLGVTVAERLRTFAGRLFRLDAHLERLFHSLDIVGVDPGMRRSEIGAIAMELAARNHRLLASGDDLGMTIFVTPGLSGEREPAPLACLHTQALPFSHWATKYTRGDALATTDIQQTPAACWPPELKCRSRMHYYLADRQARAIDPEGRALMLDSAGHVIEATTANVIAYRVGEGLLTPPKSKVIPGVSLGTLADLAPQLGLTFAERDLSLEDVATADEVFLASTSPCVWPVVRLNGKPIGSGAPGEVFQRLIRAWGELVGVDIVAQAQRFADRAI